MEDLQTIKYTSADGDEIKIDTTDVDIHQMMKIVVRLLMYMGYSDQSIAQGLEERSLD